MNCWEFMKCPEQMYFDCPAYPARGLDCWMVTGINCAKGKMQKATITEKLAFCSTCEFYITYAHKF